MQTQAATVREFKMKDSVLACVNREKDGVTAIGVCFRMGFGGSNKSVYSMLDELVSDGAIKKSSGFLDTVYYPAS